MHLRFDPPLEAEAVEPYQAPYPDPISVKRDDALKIDPERSKETDINGWLWCTGPDGREGWVPRSWIDFAAEEPVILRDYSALELTVQAGDRVQVHALESGFAWCVAREGEQGWLPQGVLLARPNARTRLDPAGQDRGEPVAS